MEKIWLKNYPKGVPAQINIDDYASLAELFNESCKRYASSTAYISMGQSLSYAQLHEAARRFAAWLQEQGATRGTRVALMMPNILQYPVALFGTLLAGCTVVNCNPLYTARELEHQLKDAQAEFVVVVENFAHTLEAARPALPDLKHVVVTTLGDMLSAVKGLLLNLIVRHVKKMVPAWSLPGHIRFADIMKRTTPNDFRPVSLDHSDMAFLQYTGGTTGVAKGAVLSHGNLVANLCQAYAWVKPYAKGNNNDFVITALPLYHIFALTANCLTFIRLGATNLLILNPRDIPGFIKELRKYPFTAFTGVNTLFNALMNNADFKSVSFEHLKLTLGGGMAVQRPVAERWKQVTGRPLTQAYGLTETSPAVTINPLDLTEFNGSIGLPVPSTEISIRDDQGKELAVNETGELCVKGPQVMRQYWHNEAETQKAFEPDGFLRTGDMGYINEDGYIFLVDRKKELIIVSGFNVYPSEIEEVVASHPGVSEVAAIGAENGASGEVVKIVVVRKDTSLTEKALIDFCRNELTGYKVPKIVEFRDELPKSAVGKILKRELKQAPEKD
ncbi:MAG: AMP-binding protein [Advenella sp.]|uniref:Long-chain-fatty-acid--CoA ligase n=1 Tax=Advenella kashmirensis TaxID=310575 RepID=A0A356LHZ0_9BURK|nr:long-chain-fatty-acid--CoA ligase [Advenella kashmirensis]